jgi:hypothetical protein
MSNDINKAILGVLESINTHAFNRYRNHQASGSEEDLMQSTFVSNEFGRALNDYRRKVAGEETDANQSIKGGKDER